MKGTLEYYHAWQRTSRERLLREYRGLIANHPKYAEATGNIQNSNGPDMIQWREPQFPLSINAKKVDLMIPSQLEKLGAGDQNHETAEW